MMMVMHVGVVYGDDDVILTSKQQQKTKTRRFKSIWCVCERFVYRAEYVNEMKHKHFNKTYLIEFEDLTILEILT